MSDKRSLVRVIVTRRPKYGCDCEEAVVQAPAPPRLIEGGIPTERLVADVVVSKYADHLPLYRQAQIFSRQGINLDRSTPANIYCERQALTKWRLGLAQRRPNSNPYMTACSRF